VPFINHHKDRRVWPAASFCLLTAWLIMPATAQSSTNSITKDSKPSSAEAIASANPKPVLSRYVDAEELPAYLNAMGAILSIRNRNTDPFGQYQDPSAKPVVKAPTTAKVKRVTTVQATPFSDIVRRIKVNTVMPAEKSFLIGTRTVKQGDELPLSFRGRQIKAQVSAVSSSAIEFRNSESGETASIKLNMLPAGMTPGSSAITAPGMISDSPDAPLNLDNGSF